MAVARSAGTRLAVARKRVVWRRHGATRALAPCRARAPASLVETRPSNGLDEQRPQDCRLDLRGGSASASGQFLRLAFGKPHHGHVLTGLEQFSLLCHSGQGQSAGG